MQIKYFVTICFLLTTSLLVHAQETSNLVEYKRIEYDVNIMSKLPYFTKDRIERERYTWGNRSEEWFTTYQLYFDQQGSSYREKPEEKPSTYAYRKDNFTLSRNLEEKTSKDLVTFNSQDFVIEGESVKYKWKILNEIKEVAGYICMKAETYDPMRKVPVQAWFTSAIASQAGPEGFGGLPGLILELVFNENDVVVTAQKVILDVPTPTDIFPKKIKGKTVTPTDFHEVYAKYVESKIKKKEYPYWRVRY